MITKAFERIFYPTSVMIGIMNLSLFALTKDESFVRITRMLVYTYFFKNEAANRFNQFQQILPLLYEFHLNVFCKMLQI